MLKGDANRRCTTCRYSPHDDKWYDKHGWIYCDHPEQPSDSKETISPCDGWEKRPGL